MMRLVLTFALVSCALLQLTSSEKVVGGLSETKPADGKVTSLVNGLKPEIAAKTGRSADDIKVISYKTQVVAGTVYFVKVQSGDDYTHLKIFQELSGSASLADAQTGKSADDDITYF